MLHRLNENYLLLCLPTNRYFVDRGTRQQNNARMEQMKTSKQTDHWDGNEQRNGPFWMAVLMAISIIISISNEILYFFSSFIHSFVHFFTLVWFVHIFSSICSTNYNKCACSLVLQCWIFFSFVDSTLVIIIVQCWWSLVVDYYFSMFVYFCQETNPSFTATIQCAFGEKKWIFGQY